MGLEINHGSVEFRKGQYSVSTIEYEPPGGSTARPLLRFAELTLGKRFIVTDTTCTNIVHSVRTTKVRLSIQPIDI